MPQQKTKQVMLSQNHDLVKSSFTQPISYLYRWSYVLIDIFIFLVVRLWTFYKKFTWPTDWPTDRKPACRWVNRIRITKILEKWCQGKGRAYETSEIENERIDYESLIAMDSNRTEVVHPMPPSNFSSISSHSSTYIVTAQQQPQPQQQDNHNCSWVETK